jgi:type IV secretory pathway TraG/TraD family ATPase VirD4
MDEFGNMPKIEKFDKFITVGRSRKIWFTMIIQSYAQLNNVYGDTVADIVKGNCGIKMFIGSNDMNTCKEYSELCGNITVVTSSSSGSVNSNDINLSNQTQVRPLIYPSELQRLNKPGDIGNSIIVTFGNYPLKTYFSPSFKVPFYQTGKMDTGALSERYFDENTVLYSVSQRNSIVFEEVTDKKEEKTKESKETKEKKAAKATKEDKPKKSRGEGAKKNKGEDAVALTADEKPEETANVQSSEEATQEIESVDSEAQTLLAMWQEFKTANPEGTLSEFYAALANINQEG